MGCAQFESLAAVRRIIARLAPRAVSERMGQGFVVVTLLGTIIAGAILGLPNPFTSAAPTPTPGAAGTIDFNQLNKTLEGLGKSLPH